MHRPVPIASAMQDPIALRCRCCLYGVKTKREAVDLALRRLVGTPLTKRFLLGLRGIGWGGDLEALRSADKVEELP